MSNITKIALTARRLRQKATVKIPKLSYGKYHIYAVANVAKELLTDEVVKNLENLKNSLSNGTRKTWLPTIRCSATFPQIMQAKDSTRPN